MDHTEKKITFYKASEIATELSDFQMTKYSLLIEEKFGWFPFDLFVFDYDDEKKELVMSIQGYNFLTNELIEGLEVGRVKTSSVRKFYCKVDDHGDHYKGVFMFPEEY